jgi:hypothetical protein
MTKLYSSVANSARLSHRVIVGRDTRPSRHVFSAMGRALARRFNAGSNMDHSVRHFDRLLTRSLKSA